VRKGERSGRDKEGRGGKKKMRRAKWKGGMGGPIKFGKN